MAIKGEIGIIILVLLEFYSLESWHTGRFSDLINMGPLTISSAISFSLSKASRWQLRNFAFLPQKHKLVRSGRSWLEQVAKILRVPVEAIKNFDAELKSN